MMVQMLLLAVGFVVFDGDGMVGRHDVGGDGVGVAVLLTALCVMLRLSFSALLWATGRLAERGFVTTAAVVVGMVVKRKKRREQKIRKK